MEDEPRNAASALDRRVEALLNDREFMVRDGLTLCAPDFVRYDRRRLTALPPADAETWLQQMLTFEELTGRWPTFKFVEVLAVRGDRLSAIRWVLGLGDMGELHLVTVNRADEAIEKYEVTYFFDPEDVDAAVAELDRLHDELVG